MKLVEIHKINRKSKYYSLFEELCKESNSLYNQALFKVKQSLNKENKWMFYSDLNQFCKNRPDKYNNYRRLPAQCSQQTLRLLDQNLKAYRNSIKDWSKNKSKYLGKPKFPKFKKSGGLFQLILTSQQVKYDRELLLLRFPKNFNSFTLKLRQNHATKINQVRILPKIDCFKIEIVYEIEAITTQNLHHNVASIDLGLENLTTLAFSNCKRPLIYKGKRLIKINHNYNRQIKKYQSILNKTQKKQRSSKRLRSLYLKRNNKIEDQMHKISKSIVDCLLENDISILIIGHNVNQKQKSTLKNFVSLPIFKLIHFLKYKCEIRGIKVVDINESYTSGTSFLDKEDPIKENYNKFRRIKRGLFKSNKGRLINSDVNSAYQIMKKFDKNLNIQYNHQIFNPRVMFIQ